MRTRKALAIIAGCILALAVLLCHSALLRDEGPSYHGKSLSKWVLLIGRRPWEDPPSPQLRRTAEQAITHIGTNGIPFLLQWIGYEPRPSKIGTRVAFLMRALPAAPRIQFLAEPRFRPVDEMRARGARNAFRLLGAKASPAIPSLSCLVKSSNDAELTDRVAEALAGIGTPALPTMINLLTNAHSGVSTLFMFYAIMSLGTNAEPAIPAILDSDSWAYSSAEPAFEELSPQSRAFADALQTLREKKEKPKVVPDTIIQLDDSIPVPFLVALLSNSEPALRIAATNALLRIAPQILTNSSLQ